MAKIADFSGRGFKTKLFAKAAHKAGIRDKDLWKALAEVAEGKCDDLGGGVFKKRLNRNEHRSIVLSKGGNMWVFEHLYAKKDKANISPTELRDLKLLAKAYGGLSEMQLMQLIADKHLMEINDGETKIQK